MTSIVHIYGTDGSPVLELRKLSGIEDVVRNTGLDGFLVPVRLNV
jgi:hypothetical protein